jgi:hypothetical protein
MRRRTPPATPSEGCSVDVAIGIAVDVAIAVDVTIDIAVDVTDPHDPSCFCVAAVKKR